MGWLTPRSLQHRFCPRGQDAPLQTLQEATLPLRREDGITAGSGCRGRSRQWKSGRRAVGMLGGPRAQVGSTDSPACGVRRATSGVMLGRWEIKLKGYWEPGHGGLEGPAQQSELGLGLGRQGREGELGSASHLPLPLRCKVWTVAGAPGGSRLPAIRLGLPGACAPRPGQTLPAKSSKDPDKSNMADTRPLASSKQLPTS